MKKLLKYRPKAKREPVPASLAPQPVLQTKRPFNKELYKSIVAQMTDEELRQAVEDCEAHLAAIERVLAKRKVCSIWTHQCTGDGVGWTLPVARG